MDGRLMCPVPALAALNLPASSSATVELFVSMDFGPPSTFFFFVTLQPRVEGYTVYEP